MLRILKLMCKTTKQLNKVINQKFTKNEETKKTG